MSKKRPRNILFIDDLTRLKKGKEFHSSSHLSSFSPYIDEKGILRVGGRLKHAPIQTEAKYPAILPRDHPITNLIVTHLHRKLKHSGTGHVLAELIQRFWVPKARSLIKKVIKQCPSCKRSNARSAPPLMASLPFRRLQPFTPPFRNTATLFWSVASEANAICRVTIRVPVYVPSNKGCTSGNCSLTGDGQLYHGPKKND